MAGGSIFRGIGRVLAGAGAGGIKETLDEDKRRSEREDALNKILFQMRLRKMFETPIDRRTTLEREGELVGKYQREAALRGATEQAGEALRMGRGPLAKRQVPSAEVFKGQAIESLFGKKTFQPARRIRSATDLQAGLDAGEVTPEMVVAAGDDGLIDDDKVEEYLITYFPDKYFK